MPNKLEILDTSLRDGAQGRGVSFTVADKLRVCRLLDNIGIDIIEGGNPGSNPKDRAFFDDAQSLRLQNSKLAVFTNTHRLGVLPQNDAAVANTLSANTECVVLFGKTWDLHVTDVLKISLEQNLEIIRSTISHYISMGKRVIFDAEHFFDGYIHNSGYAIAAITAAHDAGADTIVLCDTNGGSFPRQIASAVAYARGIIPRIGIHCHDDMGLSSACTIAAVEEGACHIQGTFGGFGERCGNADLTSIIPTLQLKLGYDCIPADKLELISSTARSVHECANLSMSSSKPYVGSAAFSHKAGMHSDAVLKNPQSYEHINPELVGNARQLLISEVSGRSAILPIIQSIDPSLERTSTETAAILEKLKEREFNGYSYEGAESSLEMLIIRELGIYKPHFALDNYKVTSDLPVSETSCYAVIKIKVADETEITAAEGDGPVNSLDTALRKALSRFYPQIDGVRLIDYKVRVLDAAKTTAANVRVVITSEANGKQWSTVGVSTDIIEASWLAIVDSIEYFLHIILQ